MSKWEKECQNVLRPNMALFWNQNISRWSLDRRAKRIRKEEEEERREEKRKRREEEEPKRYGISWSCRKVLVWICSKPRV